MKAEPREHYEPITEGPLKCLAGNFTLAGSRRARQATKEAERLPTEHRVHDPADQEGRTDRETLPIVAKAVWIEETLKDAPGGVAGEAQWRLQAAACGRMVVRGRS